MSGWKTKAAAALAAFYGLAGWALGLHGFPEAMDHWIMALGMIGIGHKIEKAAAPWPAHGHGPADLAERVRRG